MKKFYAAVAIAWFTMFFLSLRTTPAYPDDVYQETGLIYLIDDTIYTFNSFFDYFCGPSCTTPYEPVRVIAGVQIGGEPAYVVQDFYSSQTDNRMTQTILQRTFPFLLAFLFTLSFGAAIGRGTFKSWGSSCRAVLTATLKSIKERWSAFQCRRFYAQNGITVRNR